MVQEGYLMYQDIWSDQPPLLPLCLAFAFNLFGESVSVARGVIIAFACLGLVCTAWMARLLGGRRSSLIAVIFLAFNPLFVKLSRSVMVGLPAHAPAALAMVCGLIALRTKREIWLIAAGAALSASVMTKPIQLVVIVPLGMVVWWWGNGSERTAWHRWGRKLLLLTLAAIVPLLVIVSLFGGPLLVEQVVGTYLQRQVSEPFRFDLVIADTVAYLRRGGLLHWTGLVLALYGSVLAWRRRDREGMVVSIWLLCGLVAVYGQAHFRQHYLLLPSFPAAGLLSMGLRDVVHSAGSAWARPRRHVPLAAGAVVLLCLTVGTATEIRSALAKTCCRTYLPDEEAVALLRSIGTPGGYVISDYGTLTFRAGLLTPPQLAVPSYRRIETGQLSPEALIATTQAYEPQAIIFWSERFMSVPAYVSWVEQHYCLTRVWRSIERMYVRCDLVPPCERCPIQLGAFSRIVGWSLSTSGENDRVVAPGDSVLLTVRWQTVHPTDADYHVFCHLGGDVLVAQQDGRPLQGGHPAYRWVQGEEVVDRHALEVRADAPPGVYPLWVGMYDWATKDRLPVMDAEGHDVGTAALLTHVRVGRADFQVPPISQPRDAVLGDRVRLLGYDLPLEEAVAGGFVDLTLYWQCVREMDTGYTVFVHIMDSEGKIVGQWDNMPQGGGLPTTTWVSGEVISDTYEVPLAQEADPGNYTLVVGMYDGGTGRRLPATSADGARLPDDRILLGDIQLSR
jgi:hypothetical protein